ncbi:uncharacterized protein DS421_15g511450 [Arachis hypogaea]|nr:uncharacterized protein DS421_15g511450 [Arachis hypogaea]
MTAATVVLGSKDTTLVHLHSDDDSNITLRCLPFRNQRLPPQFAIPTVVATSLNGTRAQQRHEQGAMVQTMQTRSSSPNGQPATALFLSLAFAPSHALRLKADPRQIGGSAATVWAGRCKARLPLSFPDLSSLIPTVCMLRFWKGNGVGGGCVMRR